jgi:hypothetical protein
MMFLSQSKSQKLIEFALVIVVAGIIVKVNLNASSSIPILHLLPQALYLALAPLLAKADLPSVAGRTYLLCLLGCLVTLFSNGLELSSSLASLTTDPNDPNAGQRLIMNFISNLLPVLLPPMGLGVVVYAAASVFESSGSATDTASPRIVEEVGRWFATHGAAPELVNYIERAVQTTQQLEAACGSLASQATSAEQGLESLYRSAAKSEQALAGLHSLRSLDSDLARVTANIDQLNSAVTQMGQVVDELSEIISKKILEL